LHSGREPDIPIARPLLDEAEAEAARRAILSGWVTQGPEVAAFEEEFAVAVGAPHACAVSSCTTALHLALRAVGVGPGDEVLTASHSYVATANAIRHCGAVPLFVDVEPGGCNIDPGRVEESLGPRVKAILCVHQMGMPCDLAALLAIAERHGLPLVEDAACALGSEVELGDGWERIGRPRGDIACFSFHPRKILTTGDGGMLTTRHEELDRRFRLERHHGVSVTDMARHTSSRVLQGDHLELGFNYRLTDIQAAVGRVQLTRLSEIVERRRELAGCYLELLAGLPLELPVEPAWARTNWQSFWVRLPQEVEREAVMQHLLDLGIATRPGVLCAHKEPAYAVEPWRAGPAGLVESERAQDRSLLLPLFHELTEAQQERVAEALGGALEAAAPAASGRA
jgi:dTDP-4-amino-4,6-dideoxygalactose transaminase